MQGPIPITLSPVEAACRSESEIADTNKLIRVISGFGKVNGMDHQLRLYIGMEVVLTENLHLPSGLANGSRAIVQRVQLTEEASSRLLNNGAAPQLDADGFQSLSVDDVDCIICRLLLAPGKLCSLQLDDNFGIGEFPVYAKTADVRMEIPQKQIQTIFPQSYKLVQFPILPAFCVTAHKTQGLTLPKLILASTTGSGRGKPIERFLYVVLSRLKSLEGLTLLQALPADPHHSAYALGKNLIQELCRLSRVEAATINQAADFLRSLGVDEAAVRSIPPPTNNNTLLVSTSRGLAARTYAMLQNNKMDE
jgi:hypothetical protein